MSFKPRAVSVAPRVGARYDPQSESGRAHAVPRGHRWLSYEMQDRVARIARRIVEVATRRSQRIPNRFQTSGRFFRRLVREFALPVVFYPMTTTAVLPARSRERLQL